MDHNIVAQEAHTGRATCNAFGDQTAGNLANASNLEDLFDLGIADELFANFRAQKARSRSFHVIDEIVNHAVIADFDTLLVGAAARGRIGTNVKAKDRRARCLGKADIRFSDRTNPRVQHAHANLVVADLFHRLNDRLGRALNVGFDDNRHFLDVLILLGLGQKLFQRGARTDSGALLFGGAFAVFRDFACLRLGVDHVKNIARFGCTVQTQNLDRGRWACFLDTFTTVVDQSAHLAVLLADNKDIAKTQCALLDQDSRHGATAHVKLRLDHGALGGPVRVHLELQKLGLKRNRLKQLVKSLTGHGRDFDILHVTGHRLDDDFMLQKIGAYLVRIRIGLVDLVDRHDHRHLSRLGVVDRLDCLGHHGIVRRNHQNHDIGHLGTARTHAGECRVAGRIEEGQQRAALGFHLVGADMLGDAAGLA